jgi:hypothetical protein
MTDNQKHIVKTADSIPISPMTDERQAERDWRRMRDFTVDDRRVIALRRQYQAASELAEVFRTKHQTINAIVAQYRKESSHD